MQNLGRYSRSREQPTSSREICSVTGTLPAIKSRLIITGASSEEGGFDIQSVPPGEYTLLAFPDDARFSTGFLRDPERLERYEVFGERIYVAAGQSVAVTIRVAPAVDQ